MDLEQLQRIFNHYSDTKLTDWQKNDFPVANQSFIVTTADGERFVIKIFITQEPESALIEAKIQERLNGDGIITPRYLQLNNGQVMDSEKSHHFAISEFIPGQRPSRYTKSLIKSFGQTMGLIHKALNGLQVPSNDSQWLSMPNAWRSLRQYSGQYTTEIEQTLNQSEAILKLPLPETTIHGDLMDDNVFAANGLITVVFDIETAQTGLRVLDLSRTYLSMMLRGDYGADDTMRLLIQAYNAEASHPLSSEEIGYLPDFISYTAAACAAWCGENTAGKFVGRYLEAGKRRLDTRLLKQS